MNTAQCFGRNMLTSYDSNFFKFISDCYLLSSNRKFKALLDYNVLKVLSTQDERLLWSSANSLDPFLIYQIKIQGDGNLCVYSLKGQFDWAERLCCCFFSYRYKLLLEDDGKLRIYRNETLCGSIQN